MKKTVCLSILLLVLIIILWQSIEYRDQRKVCFQDNGEELLLRVQYDGCSVEIRPWYCDTERVWYYFLPSCVDKTRIWCGELESTALSIDDMANISFFEFENDVKYRLAYNDAQFVIVFRTTNNLSTVFVETKSGSLDYIHRNKENREKGTLVSLDSKGNIEYQGNLDKISGHGNGTWNQEKKSYNIKLSKLGELSGLHANTDWNLLSLWYDGDKIHSKLAFDMAAILGAPYVCDCTWVNLYMNGNYMGLYLLAEAVNSFEVFKEEQAFLLEKELYTRYKNESYYIVTENGNGFSIVRPKGKKITQQQVANIAQLVQETENAINVQDLDNWIDMDSFAVQLLVDEISLNYDAFVTSSYIYKQSNDEKIYAGPAWDYDGAFGEYLHRGSQWVNPDSTVINAREDYQLDWYAALYMTDEFQLCMIEKYRNALPKLSNLCSETVERYADWIADSVKNDSVRWSWAYDRENSRAGAYSAWDNNVRYLEYFCSNRLNALCERWQVSAPENAWRPLEENHRVVFKVNGEEILILYIQDGQTINIDLVADLKDYSGGHWSFDYNEKEAFNQYLPILEDCTLVYNSK